MKTTTYIVKDENGETSKVKLSAPENGDFFNAIREKAVTKYGNRFDKIDHVSQMIFLN